ncbi:MAG: lipopolysaccharide kinase InaA family protein [Phycisphaerales bacterium]
MIVPPTEGLRVARYAQGAGYSPDQWARALEGVDWSKAELLSDKPGSSVWRATLVVQKRPQALVIKCEPIDTLKRRVQVLLAKTHAHRHWRGAELLTRHGFRTAEPKAIVYGRRDGQTIECLVMEALEGKTVLAWMSEASEFKQKAELCCAIGSYLSTMWRQGLTNRDGKPSNLMVIDGDELRIALVDLVGVRRRAWIEEHDWHRACRDLMLEPFGCGVIPSRATRMRVCRRLHQELLAGSKHTPKTGQWREFRDELWREVGWLIESHGDPTPEHDPLSRSGRLETGPAGGRASGGS